MAERDNAIGAVQGWETHTVRRIVGGRRIDCGRSSISGCSEAGTTYEDLPAALNIPTGPWNRLAAVPSMVFMPERGRLLMLVSCDAPIQGMVCFSDDLGATWSTPEYILKRDADGNPDIGICCGLTYLGDGNAALMRTDSVPPEIWFSNDYGQTWKESVNDPPAFGGAHRRYCWDPILVDTWEGKRRCVVAGHVVEEGVSQAFLRYSADEGRSWGEDVRIPQWSGVNEVALLRAANGDMIAACRTDNPEEYKEKLDHYAGLGISRSTDNGCTWSAVNMLYDWGRHHPSLLAMPDGRIVMTYAVRLGYSDTEDGFKQFGVEALVSGDHGKSWDAEKPYILAKWPANRKGMLYSGDDYWWASPQATSTVLLPDGNLLTAFGTGYRSQPDKTHNYAPRDVGLVKWNVG
ncbi:MAG: sialidase family protein [Candidatus Latescibacterota bacterium]